MGPVASAGVAWRPRAVRGGGIGPAAGDDLGLGGGEEPALAGDMARLPVVTACLNEEEFAAAGPALGTGPGDREALLCVAEAVGGVEELAEGKGRMLALLGALAVCGLSPSGMNPGG